MKIVWLKGIQYSKKFGRLKEGETKDIPAGIAKKWIEHGWAKEVKKPKKIKTDLNKGGKKI